MTIFYGSSVADATLTTACDMASTTGGTETSKTTGLTGGNHFGEVWSQGNASLATVTAIPSTPTGHGWVVATGAGTFSTGNWSVAIGISGLNGEPVTMHFRAFRLSGGVYTSIGTINANITLSSSRATLNFSATSFSSIVFGSSDSLYVDLWLEDTTGAGGDNPVIYVSNSASVGVANDMQVTTSSFSGGSTQVFKDIAFLGRVNALTQKDIAYLAKVASTPTKDIAFLGKINGAPPQMGIAISNTAVTFDESTWQLQLKLDERQRCQFTVLDYPGTQRFVRGQKLTVDDPTLGRLFSGVAIDDKLDKSNTYPDSTIEHQMDSTDNFYFADKRTSNRQYVTPTYACKIVFDAYTDALASEGILATGSQRTDTTQADWATGTLSNVVASFNVGDGDLELGSASSVNKQYLASSDWATGTLTNVTAHAGGDLALSGTTRNWDNGSTSSQTLFGGGSPRTQSVNSAGNLVLKTGTGADIRARLDFAGSWQNFTVEVDVTPFATHAAPGIVYRTTNWGNNLDTYAYSVIVYTDHVLWAKGTNSTGSGSFTQLVSASISLTAGQAVRLKLIINGSSHQIFIDGSRYINGTDSTYTGSGQLGLRFYNASGSTQSAVFDNFGIMSSLTGTWQSASTSITSITTIASSVISWDTSLSTGGTVTVQSSIDGGSSWQNCTSGSLIPGLTSGVSGTGKSVLTKALFSTDTATQVPDIRNLSWTVSGGYLSSGSRISPALSLTPTGRVGTSLIAWNANLPSAATTLGVDISLDGGSTWIDVTAQNGGPIPGINGQPDPSVDSFDSDTSVNYMSSNGFGGSVSTWTYDTTNSRVTASGGASAVFLSNATTIANIDLFADMDESDAGGMVFCYVDAGNYYGLVVADNHSSVLTPNTMRLYRVSGGVVTQVASGSISFLRGTYHRIRVTDLDGSITASFDGVQVIAYTDGSPLGAGLVGLYQNGAQEVPYALRAFGPPVDLIGSTSLVAAVSRYYQFWVQPMGDNSAGISVMTRLRLATTDTTLTPQVLDLTVGAYGNTIGLGALIPSADYRQKYISDVLGDALKQSNYLCYIDPLKVLHFRDYAAIPAPWIVQSSTLGIASDVENDTNLANEIQNDLYRNRQWLTGVNLTTTFSNNFQGDGKTTSFTVGFPIAPGTVPTVTLNGQNQQVAQKGSTGSQWYYAENDATIAQDTSQTVLISSDLLVISGTGTYVGPVMVEDTAAQSALSLLEGGTGIVEAVEDVSQRNMTQAAALTYASQLLIRYGVEGRTLTFATYRNGLWVGQVINVFLPEEGLFDTPMTILSISVTMRTQPQNTIQYLYVVTASELPNPGSWQKLLASGLLGQ